MSVAFEENLNRALRALEKRFALAERLRIQAEDKDLKPVARSWALKAEEFGREATVIRDSIRHIGAIAARAAQEEKIGGK